MLVYDWLWWGQLTNQNRARRCVEVRGGVHGVVRGGVQRGVRRCTEGCAEVRGGVWRGVTPIN